MLALPGLAHTCLGFHDGLFEFSFNGNFEYLDDGTEL